MALEAPHPVDPKAEEGGLRRDGGERQQEEQELPAEQAEQPD